MFKKTVGVVSTVPRVRTHKQRAVFPVAGDESGRSVWHRF